MIRQSIDIMQTGITQVTRRRYYGNETWDRVDTWDADDSWDRDVMKWWGWHLRRWCLRRKWYLWRSLWYRCWWYLRWWWGYFWDVKDARDGNYSFDVKDTGDKIIHEIKIKFETEMMLEMRMSPPIGILWRWKIVSS